jgi:hypothetical protein
MNEKKGKTAPTPTTLKQTRIFANPNEGPNFKKAKYTSTVHYVIDCDEELESNTGNRGLSLNSNGEVYAKEFPIGPVIDNNSMNENFNTILNEKETERNSIEKQGTNDVGDARAPKKGTELRVPSVSLVKRKAFDIEGKQIASPLASR